MTALRTESDRCTLNVGCNIDKTNELYFENGD